MATDPEAGSTRPGIRFQLVGNARTLIGAVGASSFPTPCLKGLDLLGSADALESYSEAAPEPDCSGVSGRMGKFERCPFMN